jgi:hypothetical protein
MRSSACTLVCNYIIIISTYFYLLILLIPISLKLFDKNQPARTFNTPSLQLFRQIRHNLDFNDKIVLNRLLNVHKQLIKLQSDN